MKIVFDTNIIISASLKDSLVRKMITNLKFEFFLPSYSFSEIIKYRNYVCEKSSISEKQFDSLLKNILDYVEVILFEDYQDYLHESVKLLKDIKDTPFLACAIAVKSAIWSDDKHFKQQKKVKVFTTPNFVKKFLKAEKNL